GMTRKHKHRVAGRPPDGEPWVWHTLALLSSPPWCGMSINCHRLILFLEIEHLQHGGNENGSLLAPYAQLVRFGIGRRFIAGAILARTPHTVNIIRSSAPGLRQRGHQLNSGLGEARLSIGRMSTSVLFHCRQRA